MTETDFERFTRIVLDEFKRVHGRFDAVDEHIDTFNEKFDDLKRELSDIHRQLDHLNEAAANFSGFTKEIDHLLRRVAAIEKHLGLQISIRA